LSSEQFSQFYENYENFKKDENKIDYDDMLYLTNQLFENNHDVLDFWQKAYSHLIIDEFQDTNILQAKILYNIALPENNICIVGDDDQCQPKGTKVLLNNGEYKNIEELKIGDELASFDISSDSVNIKKNISINKVEDISSRPVYNEALISVNTAKNKTLYTYNHRTYAEINFQSNLFALYLVYDKNKRYYTERSEFLFEEYCKVKSNSTVEKVWLLNVYKDDLKAYAEEISIATRYGIYPKNVSTKNLSSIDNALKQNVQVAECLTEYKRHIHCPLFDRAIEWLNPKCYPFSLMEIYATNLIEKYMSVASFDNDSKTDYNLEEIKFVLHEWCEEPVYVYSLKTTTENYIADNIITHNCIYRFRGAVPQIMLDFEKKYPDCKKVILNVNYRSEPAIVETSKRLIENNKIRFDKPLKSFKSGEAEIYYEHFKNRDKEIAQIVKELKGKQRAGLPLDQIAILYRTNLQATQLTQAFIKADIPFFTNELVVNIYDHWIFNDIKNFKKVVDGTCTLNEFLSIINRPNKYISRKILPLNYNEQDIMNCVFKIPEGWKRDKMRETLEDWYYWIDKMETMKPAEFIACIRKNLEYDKYIKAYAETNGFDVSQFKDVIDEIEDAAKEFNTFEELLEHADKELKEFKEKMKEKKKENSVVLSTMHRAKGLEWDEVYVIDCNEEITPYSKAETKEDMEEERRMFYVAITRAKRILHIYSFDKRNKAPMYISRFVKEMKPKQNECKVEQKTKGVDNTIQLQPRTWVFHKTFGSGMITEIDGDKVCVAFSNNVGMKIFSKSWCITNLEVF
jgi:superfamily I DNA/RNA helicase